MPPPVPTIFNVLPNAGEQVLDGEWLNLNTLKPLEALRTGHMAFSGLLLVGDETLTGNTVHVGNESLTGTMVMVGNESLTGTSVRVGNETITGTTVHTGNETITGTLALSGDATIGGNETISGTMSLTGAASVGGGLVVSAAVASVHVLAAQQKAVTVAAAANTDFTLAVPPGSTVISVQAITTTAFGAVTDAKLQLGTSVSGSDYATGQSIKAAGVHAITLDTTDAAGLANILSMPTLTGGANVYGRVVQSGGNSAVGAAQLIVVLATP